MRRGNAMAGGRAVGEQEAREAVAEPVQGAGSTVQLALPKGEAERVGQPADDVEHQVDLQRLQHRVLREAGDSGGVHAVRGAGDGGQEGACSAQFGLSRGGIIRVDVAVSGEASELGVGVDAEGTLKQLRCGHRQVLAFSGRPIRRRPRIASAVSSSSWSARNPGR
jgi:hypothetical protein